MTSLVLAGNSILARNLGLRSWLRLSVRGRNHTKMMTTTALGDASNVVMNSPKKRKVVEDGENAPVLRYVKMSDFAAAPVRGTPHSAGVDLKSARDMIIPARGQGLVATDLKIALPKGHYGRIAPRSSLAHKNGIDVGAGVIDEDYRGPLGVILFNFKDKDFQVNVGDKIAQLICEKISYPELCEETTLTDTVRGEGGFGSTGKN